jgi:hypothetical protein
MVRPTVLMVFATALASCGGSIASPDGAPGDADPFADACGTVVIAPKVAGTACRFSIDPPPCDDVDRARIGVKVAGSEIPRDPAHLNGWDYTDTTMATLDIYGPNCDAITADPTLPVDIVFKILIP